MKWILDIQNKSDMTSIDIVDDNSTDIDKNDDKNYIQPLKTILISILIVINFPIIFCDLYYAINDNTCINQKMEKLAVNMYDYLIVSGIYSLIITVISILFILFFIDKMKNLKLSSGKSIIKSWPINHIIFIINNSNIIYIHCINIFFHFFFTRII